MSGKLLGQVAIALVVTLVVKNLSAPPAPAPLPPQPWAGAGTDPFGMSYTVVGKAARGGL